jgi:hypothetical protein
LRDRDVVFDPSIHSNPKRTGLRDILQKIINDFISIAVSINRLDQVGEKKTDYLVEIKD